MESMISPGGHSRDRRLSARPDRRQPALVSVVVPHLNDYDDLDRCLTLLGQQTFPRERTEIVVADNGSERGIDALRDVVGGRARVIPASERGAGPARNAGVRASRGEALAFIDSDCRPDPHWLEAGVAQLRQTDVVGGRVDVLVENPRRMTGAEAFESVFAFQNRQYVEHKKFTVTASMFVWRNVFDAVGDFQNGVPEDVDWCRRAGRMGYSIRFAEASIVRHPARQTMAELRRKWCRLTLEACEADRREGKGALPILIRNWAVILSIAPHSATILFTRRLNGIGNRLAAIGALAQIRTYRFVVAHRAVLRRFLADASHADG